jgi:hypothetical protein
MAPVQCSAQVVHRAVHSQPKENNNSCNRLLFGSGTDGSSSERSAPVD